MNENSRKRGLMVYPMPEEVGGPHVYGTYALAIRESGDLTEVRMVHTEGVAYKVADDKPWVWTDYAEVPEFTPSQLAIMADHIKPVDLADWVRYNNGASRLESNFAQIAYWMGA